MDCILAGYLLSATGQGGNQAQLHRTNIAPLKWDPSSKCALFTVFYTLSQAFFKCYSLFEDPF